LEVASTEQGPRFSNNQSGWLGEQTSKAIQYAEALPEVRSGTYEGRILRVPGVGRTDALWLKDTEGRNDLVVPIASAVPSIESLKAYPADRFTKLLREAAQKESFDNSPKAGTAGA
jgi:hypothetical protein